MYSNILFVAAIVRLAKLVYSSANRSKVRVMDELAWASESSYLWLHLMKYAGPHDAARPMLASWK